jgi:tetratricopeptide (TPR) repeat protein
MAQQLEPVRRKVALKIIKPGMDSKEVIARFEAERQALAMMEHANIARVLDGGTTESERPYFVMELVKGKTITEYADANKLTVRERLELFASVCQAVQHAHQKGIIHRDLKHANILVTLHDGKPVVKIIDFGIAKALNRELTERTLFTAYGQMVGTPQYMSPEQAEMSGLDVDTRSDIYSLGVLLYELLTGATPLSGDQLKMVAYAEMQRLIREQDPVKPSTRISSSGAELTILASQRNETPERLRQVVRGELDWIVMKALEKDRERRYSTAVAFATDVQNYLRNEPVTACPPSTWYRFRKYAYRHRIAVIVAASLVAMLAMVAVTASVFGVWARAELLRRQEAELALKQQLNETHLAEQKAASHLARYRDRLVEDALEAFMSGDLEQGRQAIQTVETAGLPPVIVRTLRGLFLIFDGKLPEAVEVLRLAVDEDPESILARSAWVVANVQFGDWLLVVEAAHELRDVTPRTDYERLLLAWALGSIPDITQLIEERPSWAVARVIRAAHLVRVPNEQNIETAIHDIQWSREVFRNSPCAILMDLYVHTSAIQFGKSNAVDTTAWEEAAARAARELEPFPDYYCLLQSFYYETIGNQPRAEELLQRAYKLGHGGAAVRAVRAYGEGDERLACDELDRATYSSGNTLRALLTVDRDRDAALSIFEEEADRNQTGNLASGLDVLLLCGEDQKAARIAKERLQLGPFDSESEENTLKFLAGEMTEEDLVASIDEFYLKDCAYYIAGLKHLARGDRAAAKVRFQKAIERIAPGLLPCHLAEAFLKRMEADERWPRSIPVKSRE